MTCVYNDIEPYVVQWLKNLSADGRIAPGSVDNRSIVEIQVGDVKLATQFHAFAGIGVWSHALRLAGWPDDVPVWTGSCPCQPFSAAGKREGFDDERHLWPEWFRLIRACRPPIIFGEQVASDDGLDWLDVVFTDLEREGYETAAADLCAASMGAPHIRQRIFFVAMANANSEWGRSWRASATRRWKEVESDRHGAVGGLADSESERSERIGGARRGRTGLTDDGATRGGLGDSDGDAGGQSGALARGSTQGSGAVEGAGPRGTGGAGELADDDDDGCEEFGIAAGEDGDTQPWADTDGCSEVDGTAGGLGDSDCERVEGRSRSGGIPCTEEQGEAGIDGADRAQHASASGALGDASGDGDRQHARELPSHEGKYGRRTSERDHPSVFAGATRGFWAGADWVWCRDGKYRPVEPGVEPLVDGTFARVGRLRAYGNSIVTQVAQAFIRCVMDEVIAREAESRG